MRVTYRVRSRRCSGFVSSAHVRPQSLSAALLPFGLWYSVSPTQPVSLHPSPFRQLLSPVKPSLNSAFSVKPSLPFFIFGVLASVVLGTCLHRRLLSHFIAVIC